MPLRPRRAPCGQPAAGTWGATGSVTSEWLSRCHDQETGSVQSPVVTGGLGAGSSPPGTSSALPSAAGVWKARTCRAGQGWAESPGARPALPSEIPSAGQTGLVSGHLMPGGSVPRGWARVVAICRPCPGTSQGPVRAATRGEAAGTLSGRNDGLHRSQESGATLHQDALCQE